MKNFTEAQVVSHLVKRGWAIFSVLGKKSNIVKIKALTKLSVTIFFAIFYLFFFENSLKIDLHTSILAIISGSITTAFGVFIS